MPTNDEFGKRMKKYEYVTRTHLITRTPVCIRLDGRSFHTFTRGFKKPYDEVLIKTMQQTMKYLCENIQGCVIGYTQSDEITLILVDYNTFTTSAWFDYNVQKIVSVSSAMATMAFNKFFIENVEFELVSKDGFLNYDDIKEFSDRVYRPKFNTAMFDSRCFNISKEEVCNCLLWRQMDATRNSIQMLGQSLFSQKELQNKSCNMIQDMLMVQKGVNWNNIQTTKKRGSCCIKMSPTVEELPENNDIEIVLPCTDGYFVPHWIIDEDIPIFSQDRNYIERFIYI